MIVWGGQGDAGLLNTGGRYDPMLDTWTPIATAGAPQARVYHQAVWSGDRMIVWGGYGCSPCVSVNSGGRYDPLTDSWLPTSLVNAPTPRLYHTAVWAGTSMVVFGGISDPSTSGVVFNTGGRYDPVSDSWRPTSTVGALNMYQHTAIWTGQLMVVSGRTNGGRYDPVADSWTWGPTAGRIDHTAVWTGTEMLVWGGQGGSVMLNTGFHFDPVTSVAWFTTTTGAPSPRAGHSAVWNGSVMIVWGGRTISNDSLGDGGLYDPVADSWSPTSSLDAPQPRSMHTGVWAGNAMILWGGFTLGGTEWNTGGSFLRSPDTDHDGFTICGGDCDDSNAAVRPGAADVCNGLDDNCNGVVDEGVDADGDGRFTCGGDCNDADATVWASPGDVSALTVNGSSPASLGWDSQAAGVGPSVVYQVASGSASGAGIDFGSASCLATVATPQFDDLRGNPARGAAYWYLIRGKDSCGTGTYGSAQSDALIPACP